MLTNTLINGLVGAITGYVTNNFAINMLFKEYFGVGGVIQKKYKDFIENISMLIEKDLINHDTLKPTLQSKQFQEITKEIIKTFLVLELPKNLNTPLKNFEGYEKSIENISDYLDQNKKTLISQTLEIYLNKPLNFYISNEQFDYILSKIEIIFQQNKNELETIFKNSISNKPLNQIFSDNLFKQISLNTNQIIKNINFEKFDGDFNKVYNLFLEIIDIDMILDEIQKDLNNTPIKNFINNSSNLSFELLDRVIKIFTSNEGEKLLTNIIDEFLNLLKNVDITLKDIFGDTNIQKFNQFLEKELPYFIETIINEIKNDQNKIETLINQSIDEALRDSGKISQLLLIIKNIFNKNIAKEKNIVTKIINSISNYKEDMPQQITQKLINYLSTQTLSSIIKDLEKNNILTTSEIVKLIQKNLINLDIKNNQFLEQILDKKLKDIYEIDLKPIKTKTLPIIFYNFKQNYLYTKLKDEIDISNIINSIKVQKITPNLKFDFSIKPILTPYYNSLNIKPKEITEFKIDFDTKNLIENFTNQNLNSYLLFLQNEKTYNTFTNLTLNSLENNLEVLVKGKISVAVSKELHKFSPNQIKDIVQEFMGKELKPINYFGAFLGSIAGAGYYMATIPFYNPLFHYASPLVYGATGVFTNYLAIKMLFRPYEKKWYLPFLSPSIVVKNKSKFANNLAHFVKQDILSDESILKIYSNQENNIKNSLKETISQNNFQILDNLLNIHNKEIANIIFEKSVEFIENNSDKISQKLVEIVISKKDILLDNTPKISNQILKEILKRDYSKEIEKYILNNLDNISLQQFTPIILEMVDKNIDIIFDKIIYSLNINNIQKIILNFENQYQQFIQNHTLKEYISPTNLNQFIIEKIYSDDIITKILQSFENKYINPQEKLNTIFNSKLQTFIYQNIDYLIEILIQKIQHYKEEIKQEIINDFNIIEKTLFETPTNKAIDNIFEKALPNYILSKKTFIKNLGNKILDYKLEDIGIHSLNETLIKEKIVSIINNPTFKQNLNQTSFIIINTLLNINLKTTLKISNINNLKQLLDIFNPILEKTLTISKQNIQKNKNQIPIITKQILNPVLNEILQQNPKNFLTNVNLQKEIIFVLETFKNDKTLISNLEKFLTQLLYQIFNSNFYSQTILQNDIQKIITNLEKEKLKDIFIPFLEEFALKFNLLIDDKLKQQLLNIIINSLFDSIKINLPNLIKAVNIQEIIKREINQMNPKEIEDLFYSFAGDYFNKIIIYGAGGAIFGVVSLFV